MYKGIVDHALFMSLLIFIFFSGFIFQELNQLGDFIWRFGMGLMEYMIMVVFLSHVASLP